MLKGIGRPGKVWLGVALSATLVITGAVVAGATVIHKAHPKNSQSAHVICRPDGRRTVESGGVYYIVRNDVIAPERECITLQRPGVGFVVTESHANSLTGDNDAFPEVLYGCAWGLCSKNTVLPRRVWRLRNLVTSWGASWRRTNGHFNVAYDIWFGHRATIHGHALGAEMMIWLGDKRFGTPTGDPIYRIDGVRWYYARHTACDIFYGCWDYVLFNRVVPTTHVRHLGLLPFIREAERLHQIRWWWYLKSVDVGFEIWQQGRGLAVHSYSLFVRLWPLPHKKHSR